MHRLVGTLDERADREQTELLIYRDSAGRVADSQNLRHRFISNLVRKGVHPKTAQTLARHGRVELTLGRYPHVLREDEQAALES